MAREPEKVNFAYVRRNRGGINRQLHLDSRILLLDRERQRKRTIDKRDENGTKSCDDVVLVRIL
jgi:hypothetical protein